MRIRIFLPVIAGVAAFTLAGPVLAQQYGNPQDSSSSYDVFERDRMQDQGAQQQGLQEGEPTRQQALIYGEQEGYGWTAPDGSMRDQGLEQQRGRFGGPDSIQQEDQLGIDQSQQSIENRNLGSTTQGLGSNQTGSGSFDQGSALESDRLSAGQHDSGYSMDDSQ